MDKKIIIASLMQIANELDEQGEFDTANEITELSKKIATAGLWSGIGNAIKKPFQNYAKFSKESEMKEITAEAFMIARKDFVNRENGKDSLGAGLPTSPAWDALNNKIKLRSDKAEIIQYFKNKLTALHQYEQTKMMPVVQAALNAEKTKPGTGMSVIQNANTVSSNDKILVKEVFQNRLMKSKPMSLPPMGI